MRLTETSTLFRNEDSGEMHGLIRVRQFTISEGHFIIRPDQLEQEFSFCLEMAKYMLDTVGLLEGSKGEIIRVVVVTQVQGRPEHNDI